MHKNLTRVLASVVEMPRSAKRAVQVLIDIGCVLVAFVLARWFWPYPLAWTRLLPAVLFVVLAIPFGMQLMHVYRSVVRFLTPAVVMRFMLVCLSVSWVAYLLARVMTLGIPGRVLFDVGWLTLVLTLTARLLFIQLILISDEPRGERRRILIYGAGRAGRELKGIFSSLPEYKVVAFVDDDPRVFGADMLGVPVIDQAQIGRMVDKYGVKEVVLAIPSASSDQRRQILVRLEKLCVAVRTVPALGDIASGKANLAHLETIKAEELLGREPIPPDPELMATWVTGRSVMITGAGGTIGSELCRQVMANEPTRLILFDMSEIALYEIEREMEDLLRLRQSSTSVVPVLGSVRDRALLASVIRKYEVKVVYHAAAYKHVPLVECNTFQGVENNVMGTLDAATVCQQQGVAAFVMISTDKAVRPTNIMGASKRLAELAVQSLASTTLATRFSIVRFGNVLRSSGSVIPLFRRQILSGGPVTVTHPQVYRYFMTVTEATQLVMQAAALGGQGDIFVLDMGEPVNIYELALHTIRLHGLRPITADSPEGDIRVEITGLRPGEKLREELLTEHASPTRHPRILNCLEPKMSSAQFQQLFVELKKVCEQRDEATLRRLLMSIATVAYSPVETFDSETENATLPQATDEIDTADDDTDVSEEIPLRLSSRRPVMLGADPNTD